MWGIVGNIYNFKNKKLKQKSYCY